LLITQRQSRSEHLAARSNAGSSSRAASAVDLDRPALATAAPDGGDDSASDDEYHDARSGLEDEASGDDAESLVHIDDASDAPPPTAAQVGADLEAAMAEMDNVEAQRARWTEFRPSLPPPPPPTLTASEYFGPTGDASCHPPGLGRPLQTQSYGYNLRTKVGLAVYTGSGPDAVLTTSLRPTPPFGRWGSGVDGAGLPHHPGGSAHGAAAAARRVPLCGQDCGLFGAGSAGRLPDPPRCVPA